jgi:NADPH-dependent 2,4-dienoyl-CoA reductase/sulfur reductase-like enzyme
MEIVMSERMLKFVATPQAMPDKRPAAERRRDFDEIYANYAREKAAEQAARCSQCGVPFCQIHCPLHNNIPDWLKLTAEGRLEEAYELSSATNNFPEICGRICPQDRLCEGNCVIEKGFESVTIGSVEKFITDTAWDKGWVQPIKPRRERPESVGIVGAGPAGLAAAVSAAERGFPVTLFEKADEIGGQFRLAMRVPGKEDFAETLRYYTRRLEVLGVDVRLDTEATEADLAAYDEVIVATGVTPRIPELGGIDHPKVVTYAEVLSGTVVPGKRVAVIGAGGIGFDVAEFLTDGGEGASLDAGTYFRQWGVDTDYSAPGGLTAPERPKPPRTVHLLQRRTSKVGAGLGKTTGWIHRTELKHRGVAMTAGATYERIDDEGLHVSVDETKRVLPVDTVVLCTGQEPQRGLYEELSAAGRPVHLIGGADVAAELDAKRAIDQGTRLAATL